MKPSSLAKIYLLIACFAFSVLYGEEKKPDPIQSWNGTYFQDQGNSGLSVTLTISECKEGHCLVKDIAETNYYFAGNRMGSCGFDTQSMTVSSPEQAKAEWSLKGYGDELFVCAVEFRKSGDGKLVVKTNGQCEDGFQCLDMAGTKILDGEFHKIFDASFPCNLGGPYNIRLNKAETLICQNEELARLDLELSKLFKNKTQDSQNKTFVISQKKWIKKRNLCSQQSNPIDCLKTSYKNRINDLK